MADEVMYELDGHVATLTLNRPDQRNAVSPELTTAMDAAMARFEADDDVVGRRADRRRARTSAPAPTSRRSTPAAAAELVTEARRLRRLRPLPPHQAGRRGGAGLRARRRDRAGARLRPRRRRHRRAVRPAGGDPRHRRGRGRAVPPAPGASRRPGRWSSSSPPTGSAPRRPPASAWSTTWSSRTRSLDRARELAERICRNAPLAVRESLAIARDALRIDDAEAWERSAAAMAAGARRAPTRAEGVRAFVEKRPAQWTGR